MAKTTIEITEARRDQLRAERLPHESSYDDTIARLLDEGTGGQLWTEAEIERIVERKFEDLARR